MHVSVRNLCHKLSGSKFLKFLNDKFKNKNCINSVKQKRKKGLLEIRVKQFCANSSSTGFHKSEHYKCSILNLSHGFITPEAASVM